VQFSWPLALRELTMGLSRPLINLWVARGEHGTEELAVLIIVFPFIHVACECLERPLCSTLLVSLSLSLLTLLFRSLSCTPLLNSMVWRGGRRLAERAEEPRGGVQGRRRGQRSAQALLHLEHAGLARPDGAAGMVAGRRLDPHRKSCLSRLNAVVLCHGKPNVLSCRVEATIL